MASFKSKKFGLFSNKDYSCEGKYIRDRMENFYNDAISENEGYWAQASIDSRFMAGDQTLWNELYGVKPRTQKPFSFNRVRRIINMISGYQRKNRKSITVAPVENGDQHTADQFTKLLFWMFRNDGTLETISDGFQGALISGINLLQMWMDYSKDPVSGDLRINNCSYNTFLMDPYFKKKDLSDCNVIWKRSYLTKNQIKTLMPRQIDKEALEKATTNKMAGMYIDGFGNKFTYMPEDFFKTTNNDKYNQLFAYDEFYYRDTRKKKMLMDTQTGETLEWSGKDDKDINQNLKDFLNMYPQVRVINQQVPTVKLAVVVDGNVIYDGKNLIGTDNYPFVPIIAYFNPELEAYSNRIQSVIRDLRDPQYLYNRRKNIELEMLEAQVNSGWKYKEDALVDPKSVFLSGEGRGIALKSTAQMTDVEKIVPGQIPPSVMQLSESLSAEIQQISGVNEELLGSAVDDKAGILSMLRQGAGLTTLQGLFDNLDLSMKILGKQIISVIQANFTPGKVKKILEEEPSPQFYNRAFGTYDAAVEEGVNTTTQKQMQLNQLLHLRETGIPIPDKVIIESLTIQNKTELLEAIEQEKQAAAQAEQAQQQAAQQLQNAQANLANARAHADMGLGDERYSRIPENRAQAISNIAEANKDDEQALLNKMKAIAELEQMDLEQLNKLVTLANALKSTEQVEKEKLAEQTNVS